MQKFIFFCARYEIDFAHPVHRSATAVVYYGVDNQVEAPVAMVLAEDAIDETGNTQVTLSHSNTL
jgi:hypothetical protein